MNNYKKEVNTVDIVRFKDDLNPYIMNPELKIVLKSILHEAVKERIVEHIDMSPRTNKLKISLEQEASQKFLNLTTDIVCGCLAKGFDVTDWFLRFSTFVKGNLSQREFVSALDSLQVSSFDPLQIDKYYDHLLQR